jgi:hypothetical protein
MKGKGFNVKGFFGGDGYVLFYGHAMFLGQEGFIM